MFVFPAFDSNYKTRKRVFRCCERCRAKRIKCRFSDDEKSGCLSCLKHGEVCSFSPQNNSGSTVGQHNINNVTTDSSTPPIRSGKVNTQGTYLTNVIPNDDNSTASIVSPTLSESGDVDIKLVTPMYLKQQFNFVVSGMLDERGYEYVFHDHPKVVINNKISDSTFWHESGIHVGYSNPKTSVEDGTTVPRKRKILCKPINASDFHIKDKRTYKYLLSINAFSLTTGEYAFTNSEIRRLIDIYFVKINSIFPIVNTLEFWEEYQTNRLPSIVIYAILIVILKDSQAEPILKAMFQRNGKSVDDDQVYIDYITELENKIRQILLVLPQLGDYDKLTRLATKLLLSMHFSYDRLGNEESAHDLTDAINLALLMGIHMKRQITDFNENKLDHLNNLWWCCYIFDRFNALINSRTLFISLKDFNIDPPRSANLLKLTQVAKSLENMLLDIYRPFKRDTKKSRNEVYDLNEFHINEFDLCQKDQSGELNEFGVKTTNSSVGGVTGVVETYVASSVYLLTRLVNNVVILAGQKSKFDNPHIANNIPEEIAYIASTNILWYMNNKLEEVIMNFPMIPWCISLGMAVTLKRKAKQILISSTDFSAVQTNNDLNKYIKLLEKYSKKWWVVDEICKLSKEFEKKLEAKKTRELKRSIPDVLTDQESKKPRDESINSEMPATQDPVTAYNIPQISNLLNETSTNNLPIRSQYSFSNLQDFSSNSFLDYFGSVQVGLFDNEILMDLPPLMMSPFESDLSIESEKRD